MDSASMGSTSNRSTSNRSGSVSNRNAHEILPGLWLGNKGASQDQAWLQSKQISVIFNCTKDLPFVNTSMSLYRIPLDDNLEPSEIRNLEHWSWETVYKLMAEQKKGNKILVHCFAGMQRSAAVIAIYLVAMFRCTTAEAIAFIKQRRPIAFHSNANFYNSIKGFEDGFRDMISRTESFQKYRKIPLPTDRISNS